MCPLTIDQDQDWQSLSRESWSWSNKAVDHHFLRARNKAIYGHAGDEPFASVCKKPSSFSAFKHSLADSKGISGNQSIVRDPQIAHVASLQSHLVQESVTCQAFGILFMSLQIQPLDLSPRWIGPHLTYGQPRHMVNEEPYLSWQLAPPLLSRIPLLAQKCLV